MQVRTRTLIDVIIFIILSKVNVKTKLMRREQGKTMANDDRFDFTLVEREDKEFKIFVVKLVPITTRSNVMFVEVSGFFDVNNWSRKQFCIQFNSAKTTRQLLYIGKPLNKRITYLFLRIDVLQYKQFRV